MPLHAQQKENSDSLDIEELSLNDKQSEYENNQPAINMTGQVCFFHFISITDSNALL